MLTRLSLKFKLTTLVVTLVTVGAVGFAEFVGQGIHETLTQAAGSGVLVATQVLSQAIDPNWLATLNPIGEQGPQYKQLEETLGRHVANGSVVRVELVKFLSDGSVEQVMSLPVDGTEDYSPPGQRYPFTDSWYTQPQAGYNLWRLERPGTFVVAWVPIMNKAQKAGMLAVITDATGVQESLLTVNIGLYVIILLLPALAGTVAYLFSASFERMAVTDGLMGIYNRKFFMQRLEQEVARSRRYGHQTTIVLLDIDFFKRVNDTYGHTTGDLVLKNLAKWIKESCRNTDVVCRYGGEEIVVILTHTALAGAQEFAERLRIKVSESVNRDPGENAEFRVTVSVGVAQWEKGVDVLGLIKRADAALYHSKHNGRNRVTIYTDDIPLETVMRKEDLHKS